MVRSRLGTAKPMIRDRCERMEAYVLSGLLASNVGAEMIDIPADKRVLALGSWQFPFPGVVESLGERKEKSLSASPGGDAAEHLPLNGRQCARSIHGRR